MTYENYKILIDELSKAAADNRDASNTSHNDIDRRYFAARAERIEVIIDECYKAFTTKELIPCYSSSADITFILEYTKISDEVISAEVVGLYHGSPEDDATKKFADGKTIIVYDPV